MTITETRHPSRDVEQIIPIARSSLLWMADRLPVTRHGRAGKARQWSVKDICVIYIAQKIADRGISPAAAIDMASAAEKHFVAMGVEEAKDGTKYYLAALMNPDAEGRYQSIITADPDEALDFVDQGGVTVFNLTKLVTEVLRLILAHEKAKKAKGASNA